MRIRKHKTSSTCKDGSLVREYFLTSPVEDQDITRLEKAGALLLKDIGGNTLFTFTSDILAIKGMIGDNIMYVTHRKENSGSADDFMNQVFETE